MKKYFYITTPLYYVNDKPHIGHAYTTIAADIIARYKRLKGERVFLLTGTDEHGSKIENVAKENGCSPKEWADKIVTHFKTTWERLLIEYDHFIRTTDEEHITVVKNVFQKLQENGFIYKGKYTGWYCVPCETFLTETQLQMSPTAENKSIPVCPDCQRPVEKISEESYFFKLSLFQEALLQYYEKYPTFLQPTYRASEIKNFVSSGLKDLSISRSVSQVSWGIPVPKDDNYTIYVWFDALINYISACKYSISDDNFYAYWPADCHLVGKEIFRFHTVIWPAMLMGLGIEPPRCVFAHGWWTVEGEKMSKSRGNIIDPNNFVDDYGADAFRYFLFREMPFGKDGNFSVPNFINRYNNELCNELGNLVSRVLALIERHCNNVIPSYTHTEVLYDKIVEIEKKIEHFFNFYELQSALIAAWELVALANKYIDNTQPWSLAKDNYNKFVIISHGLCEVLRYIAIFLYPFLPNTAYKIFLQLGIIDESIPLKNLIIEIRNKYGQEFFSTQSYGKIKLHRINKREVLFKRKA
jgi:methionyl-tRNA synthetase